MSEKNNFANTLGEMAFKFKDFQLPKIEPINSGIVRRMNEELEQQVKEMNELKEIELRKKEAYDQEVLQTLKNIESNTVGLNEVIPLLSKSLGNQEEILNYLKEALSISASKTKEEAEGKWRTVMNKATQITTDVETIQKLHGFANTILKLFIDN
jgi:hypothetical protein